MGKIEEREGKKYLIVDGYMLDIVLDKIKETIGIKKSDYSQYWLIWIIKIADNKFLDITFKNVFILMTCNIKDDGKFYPQIFLEEALLLA